MAVTTGSTTGSTSSNEKKSSTTSGSGGQRGAGSNYGPGSGKPGTTSSSASKASAQTSAPGKTDKEAPAPTSTPGKTDKVGTSEAAKKPGLSGITTQRQQAAFDKQKDLYTQAGGASASMRSPSGQKESAKVVDPSRGPNRGIASTSSTTSKTAAGKTDQQALSRPSGTDTAWGGDLTNPQRTASGKTSTPAAKVNGSGTDTSWGGGMAAPKSNVAAKTDKQPSATVQRSAPSGFIDSLVNRGDFPGAYVAQGSLLGARPTKPSMSQSVAMDLMSYDGPRAGMTAATPASQPDMGIDEAVAQLADIVKRAQQGTLLSDYASPAALKTDLVRGPAAPAAPAMADPRLAQLQEQFNRIAAARGQQPSGTAPPAAPASPAAVGQMTNPMYRDPMAQAKASHAAVSLAMGQAPGGAPPSGPLEIDVPGYPAQVAPSQQGILGGNVFNRSPGDMIREVNIASDKVRGVGDMVSPPAQTAGPTAPSQEGNYPPDENFTQYDGQPQSYAELKNRAGYEKDRAIDGFKDLPQRLFDAITRGDIRGYTPETNDKRPVTRPQQPQMPDNQSQIAAVARLLALLKAMEQQGGNQSQADLVNSTFI